MVKDKNIMFCRICDKELYSGKGLGCKMCGMALEDKYDNFCCNLCKRKYNTINKNGKRNN